MNTKSAKNNEQKLHWLVRPKTIKGLWIVGIVVLAFVTWLGTLTHPHVKFGIEGTFAFSSWYGFITCVGMVIFAKCIVGIFLTRKDTYYDD